MSEIGVRVRIAPSPTGVLHIGTARTALFNWLFARRHDGIFILRIEDTDSERSKPEFEKNIIENLAWLDISYDEFYRQSEGLEIYKKYLERLLEAGNAFFCDHTRQELEREQETQRQAKKPPRHVCQKRDAGLSGGIVRMKNNFNEHIIVHDLVRGDVTYDPQLFGDFSLAKSVNEPLYNFAAVVDDAEMRISHVIRGEDHLTNTPKQIMIERALNLAEPKWAHLPLLLGADRSKLSKRHGALGVGEYRQTGYLAEALVNFLALLGWHPSDEAGEVFSKDELIKLFSLDRVQKGGAIADMRKLDWLNREHIKRLPKNVLYERMDDFLGDAIPKERKEFYFDAVIPRLTRISEVKNAVDAIVHPPSYKKELLLWNGKIEQKKLIVILGKIIKQLDKIAAENFQSPHLEAALKDLIEKEGSGVVLWPLRAALSGVEASPGPFEIASAIGKDEALSRIHHAAEILA